MLLKEFFYYAYKSIPCKPKRDFKTITIITLNMNFYTIHRVSEEVSNEHLVSSDERGLQ